MGIVVVEVGCDVEQIVIQEALVELEGSESRFVKQEALDMEVD